MAYMTANGRDHPQARQSGLRACAAFDGGTASIAAARDFCGDFLHVMSLDGRVPVPDGAQDRLLGDMQLVVSELVTNACKYAPGPIALALEIRGPLLEISLWDTGSELPSIGTTGPALVGRHGLEIVLAVCHDVDVCPEPVGKRITATLDLHTGTPLTAAR